MDIETETISNASIKNENDIIIPNGTKGGKNNKQTIQKYFSRKY